MCLWISIVWEPHWEKVCFHLLLMGYPQQMGEEYNYRPHESLTWSRRAILTSYMRFWNNNFLENKITVSMWCSFLRVICIFPSSGTYVARWVKHYKKACSPAGSGIDLCRWKVNWEKDKAGLGGGGTQQTWKAHPKLHISQEDFSKLHLQKSWQGLLESHKAVGLKLGITTYPHHFRGILKRGSF